MVSFHTNGLLLTEDMSERLIRAGLDHLTISIDGATKETYKATRGAKLETLLENLRGLQRAKERLGSRYPRIMFKSVLMKQNLHELPELVDLADMAMYQAKERGETAVFSGDLESS